MSPKINCQNSPGLAVRGVGLIEVEYCAEIVDVVVLVLVTLTVDGYDALVAEVVDVTEGVGTVILIKTIMSFEENIMEIFYSDNLLKSRHKIC